MITGEITFQKRLVKKSKFVWRKKNPPRAQIFRYFRIESRNKNAICWELGIKTFPVSSRMFLNKTKSCQFFDVSKVPAFDQRILSTKVISYKMNIFRKIFLNLKTLFMLLYLGIFQPPNLLIIKTKGSFFLFTNNRSNEICSDQTRFIGLKDLASFLRDKLLKNNFPNHGLYDMIFATK